MGQLADRQPVESDYTIAGAGTSDRVRQTSTRRPSFAAACASPLSSVTRPTSATVLWMSETLRLTIVYEDGGDGWIVASIPEVPGAHSQGHTRQEARENVIDALQTMLTPDEELQEPADREALVFTAQP
jgi:predicted RNase H-like HicB family nuclease